MTRNHRQLQQKLHHLPTRREFLGQSGGGLGSLALAAMLGRDEALAQGGKLHHPAKAKRVVHFLWQARQAILTFLITNLNSSNGTDNPAISANTLKRFRMDWVRG